MGVLLKVITLFVRRGIILWKWGSLTAVRNLPFLVITFVFRDLFSGFSKHLPKILLLRHLNAICLLFPTARARFPTLPLLKGSRNFFSEQRNNRQSELEQLPNLASSIIATTEVKRGNWSEGDVKQLISCFCEGISIDDHLLVFF